MDGCCPVTKKFSLNVAAQNAVKCLLIHYWCEFLLLVIRPVKIGHTNFSKVTSTITLY